MNESLNILSLNRMGEPSTWREAVYELEYMMPIYAKEHNHIVHDINLPLPDFVKDIEFHAIILGPTFLGIRRYANFREIVETYGFIANSCGFKIAMPQDDYAYSKLLDDLMVNWKVDVVYTVCPENWHILYPNYIKRGTIKLGYTGYISDKLLDVWSSPKPLSQRTIDISYRASDGNRYLSSIGNLKYEIAQRFKTSLPKHNLKLDISVDPKDTIYRSNWYDFIENSKFCLVTPSGSSLLDPVGEYIFKVKKYTTKHIDASFYDVELNCFSGEDGKFVFTAISPRNIEAALADTVQIAIPSSYNGLFKSMEHYIPLDEDCSNIDDVLKMMADHELVSKIQKNCKSAILSEPGLRFVNHVNTLLDLIKDHVSKNKLSIPSKELTNKVLKRYHQEVIETAKWYWKKKKSHRKSNSFIKRIQIAIKRNFS